MPSFEALFVGDPAPWFRQRCTTARGDYTFDMIAGRFIILYFFGSSQEGLASLALDRIRAQRHLFDDKRASFFGVSADPADETEARLQAELPGIRHFFDVDGAVGRPYGARDKETGEARGIWYVLDPLLRVRGVLLDGADAAEQVLALVARLPQPDEVGLDQPVPALMLPDVFEPEFCARLMDYLARSGSTPSGVFTQAAGGPSEAVTDTNFKRRRDCTIRDPALVGQVQARIIRRVVPEIRKVFQFEASRLERLILASYDATDRGCFGPHRDNTVSATAHRRFAVSVNLNDGFEGGELVFPEFGTRRFRPPAGGAVVFSCSLMHAVMPVTAGRRIACLPFVYDEAAALLKKENRDKAVAAGS